MFKEYLRYIANRRCQQIGVDQMFPGASNPFPWMSEMTDLKKERKFLRDPGNRVPNRGCAQLGVGLAAFDRILWKEGACTA